ncbi:MAG: CRISPR-associated endonuclease Cas1 [Conexivisphaerales archaeon]
MPYDSIIIEGHYGNISFDGIRWLMKHDALLSILDWNGNLLSTILPKETNNGNLKIKQYQDYINQEARTEIAEGLINERTMRQKPSWRGRRNGIGNDLEPFPTPK